MPSQGIRGAEPGNLGAKPKNGGGGGGGCPAKELEFRPAKRLYFGATVGRSLIKVDLKFTLWSDLRMTFTSFNIIVYASMFRSMG